ncbi:MAG: hypothetical protein JNM99_06600 [Verrucomicrobiaceae bacterium]|nr:hypothetical protein [Verrucomicrobiaceae bacterium]
MTGHDELATVGGLKAKADFGLGAGLVRAELLLRLEGRRLTGLVGADEFFEVVALFANGLGSGAIFGEDAVKRGAWLALGLSGIGYPRKIEDIS